MKESKTFGLKFFPEGLIMNCKAFGDSSIAIDLTRLSKIHPRTKHINIAFNHFHEY